MSRLPPGAEPADAGAAVTRADLRLLGPALAGWVGVAAMLSVDLRWLAVIAVGLLLATVGLLAAGRGCHQRGRPGRGLTSVLALAGAAVALVLMAVFFHRELRSVGTISTLAQDGASVSLRASVASDPILLPANGTRRTPLALVRLQVHEVVGRGARSAVGTPVLAFADVSWMRLRWGEQVQVRGRLAPARRGDDVVATLSGKGTPAVRSPPGAVRRAAGSLRSGLQRASQGAPGPGAGLLPGLVVGDTSRLDPAVQEDMRAAGLTHLVAVSGSNVAIVCGATLLLAGRCGLRRRWRAPLAALALVAFVVVARPEPSVLRAAVMGGVGLVGLASARRTQGIPALSAAVLVLLVVDPWLARSYGFALSVLASLGLLILARPWADWLATWMPRWLALALAVPLAAQAACGPVIVLLQGSVSIVAVPANLLAAPFVAPATIAGVVAAAVSPLSGPVASVLAWGGVIAADAIVMVARLAARVPAVPWPGGAAGAVSLALVTAAVVFGARPAVRAGVRHPWAAAALLPIVLAVTVPTRSAGWPPPDWVMVMCDVGQGDGLVLATSPRHAMVVDTGPDPAVMDRCLDRLGVDTIDLLVLTHDHADHVEGLPGAIDGRRVGLLLLNGLDDPPAEARRIAHWAEASHLTVRRAEVGSTGDIAGVHWQVLWPRWVIHEGSMPNNDSVVLLVQTHGLRLLLLGDVETPAARQVDRALRALPAGPAVDVLKVAHHGSALQDPGLVQDVSARLALVSVGAGNTYGHPAASTLALLRGTGATVRRTDQDGDIAVISHDGRLSVLTRPP
jgi:competence protein ComEC